MDDANEPMPEFAESAVNRELRRRDPLGFFEPRDALVPASLGAIRQAPSP